MSRTCIITDIADVLISKDVEVKRFHIALRTDEDLRITCTDASQRRIRKAVAEAGDGAYHVYDTDRREVVILKPVSQLPLRDYLIAEGKIVGIHLVKKTA